MNLPSNFKNARVQLLQTSIKLSTILDITVQIKLILTLEALGGGGVKLTPPSIFLALNFCSLTDCQKLWYNCSLFVNTSFDTN